MLQNKSIFKTLIFTRIMLVFLGLYACGAQGQLKVIDKTAYHHWKRLKNQQLSQDGQWVLYSYSRTDYRFEDKGTEDQYLYNTKNGKKSVLTGINGAAFFNSGKWLKYSKKDSIFFMNLSSGKKIYWEKGSFPSESISSPIISYKRFTNAKQDLILLNLETNDSIVFQNIVQSALIDNSKSALLIQIQNGKQKFLKRGTNAKEQLILSSNEIEPIEFNLFKNQYEGTFTAGKLLNNQKADFLYYFNLKTGTTELLLDFNAIDCGENYKAVRKPYSIKPGEHQLLLDIVPKMESLPLPKVNSRNDFDLELWTWNETVSKRKQRKSSGRQNNTDWPRFIFNLDSKKCVQIAPEKTERIVAPESGNFSHLFAIDTKPYAIATDWDYVNHFDLYLVDVRTGKSALVGKNIDQYPQWSPDGKTAVFYDKQNKAWTKLNAATNKFEAITETISSPVYQEQYDLPNAPPCYGMIGWTNDGEAIAIYDRYDIWILNLKGRHPAKCLTKGWGRENEIVLRMPNLQDNINILKPLMLTGFNEQTKSTGIYQLDINGQIKVLTAENAMIKIKEIAPDGKSCIFTKERSDLSPDLWYCKTDFKKARQITDLNPQQKEYLWTNAKLVKWKNFEGFENQGVLYLPEDYNPAKKYPMIVNFYETHSQDLFRYFAPEYTTATIDITTYVSNGYIVFRPDIKFKVGAPGESAYNAVVSGTQAMIDQGYADKDNIGLQGHSWGGYSSAYILTRTNIFKCANLCAALVNMTDNYLDVRSSGAPSMFMYEQGQVRMGQSLFENKPAYVKNSPIFGADAITTPVLILHNDADGAVPFSQGLNFFLALRRMQKPAWLMNYKKEGHELNSREAQIDWSEKMSDFFDFYLKTEKKPIWMQ